MSLPRVRGGAVLTATVIGFILSVAVQARAQGVSVAPSRILLDGRTRSATVFLSNRGDETETYRISLVPMIMREDGALIPADSTRMDRSAFAEDVVRFSPRRVVIPAGGSQTVRLLVRRPRDETVEDVEYRAHLSVRSIPTVPRLDEVTNPLDREVPEDQVLAVPVASVETLVPLVVRFGKPWATARIAEPRLLQDDEGRTLIGFSLLREGTRSLYGQVTITHEGADGETSRLYYGRGIAVYTPNAHRVFRIPVNETAETLDGRISIVYQETSDGGGDQEARAVLTPRLLSQR